MATLKEMGTLMGPIWKKILMGDDNGKTSLNRRLAMLMMAILATLKATMLMPNEFPSPGRHRHGSEKAHQESMG